MKENKGLGIIDIMLFIVAPWQVLLLFGIWDTAHNRLESIDEKLDSLTIKHEKPKTFTSTKKVEIGRKSVEKFGISGTFDVDTIS